MLEISVMLIRPDPYLKGFFSCCYVSGVARSSTIPEAAAHCNSWPLGWLPEPGSWYLVAPCPAPTRT